MMQFLPAQAHPLPARVAGRTGRRHRLVAELSAVMGPALAGRVTAKTAMNAGW